MVLWRLTIGGGRVGLGCEEGVTVMYTRCKYANYHQLSMGRALLAISRGTGTFLSLSRRVDSCRSHSVFHMPAAMQVQVCIRFQDENTSEISQSPMMAQWTDYHPYPRQTEDCYAAS